ncbi:hypothetical protein AB205_0146210 [Aquarana catesbeiana]|uniref:Uncharacterized protein n=1 Tax=Aquarana catesbeiana TaxID=8400 RepID=A0A2G9Q5V9_AQUCT|nr:hypothetical protein AB205_0146210 [Aquarana catesbeiana]
MQLLSVAVPGFVSLLILFLFSGDIPAGEGVCGDRSQLWDWGWNRYPFCWSGGSTGPKWKKPGEAAGDGPALRRDLWPEAPPGPWRSDR